MAKQPIWWHQQCLKNAKAYQEHAKAELEAMQKKVAAQQARIERREAQIERAVREGRDGFDEDKYQPEKGGA